MDVFWREVVLYKEEGWWCLDDCWGVGDWIEDLGGSKGG